MISFCEYDPETFEVQQFGQMTRDAFMAELAGGRHLVLLADIPGACRYRVDPNTGVLTPLD